MTVVREIILLAALLMCGDCNFGGSPEPSNPLCEAPIGRWQSLGLESETVTAIALHPIDPRIIYAGTQFDFSAGVQGKFFKSTNCGTTWDTLMIGGSYTAILLDPVNPEIVYAVPGSIKKSYDEGRTWQTIMNGIQPLLETRVASLAMDPNNPNVLYAGLGGFYGGPLYKSIDAGANWQNISGDDPYLGSGIISIAIDPNNSNTVFVGTAGPGVVLRSTNAGATWNLTGLGETGQLIDMIAFVPSNQVFAGVRFRGLYRSTDEGVHWSRESLPDSVEGVLDLLMVPRTLGIYIATEEGCFQEGNSGTWQSMNEGLRNIFLGPLKVDRSGTNMYAGIRKLDGTNGGIFVRRL